MKCVEFRSASLRSPCLLRPQNSTVGLDGGILLLLGALIQQQRQDNKINKGQSHQNNETKPMDRLITSTHGDQIACTGTNVSVVVGFFNQKIAIFFIIQIYLFWYNAYC